MTCERTGSMMMILIDAFRTKEGFGFAFCNYLCYVENLDDKRITFSIPPTKLSFTCKLNWKLLYSQIVCSNKNQTDALFLQGFVYIYIYIYIYI